MKKALIIIGSIGAALTAGLVTLGIIRKKTEVKY